MKNRKFVFDKYSIGLFVLGIIFTIIGYIVMGTGDITISPILLIIAYLVLFPLSIISGLFRRKEE
ncbi:MAG: hypothetical protein WCX83_05050 [Candidatus Cloacimonas sp.]|jgi:heme/copper-type cytochrome/quinol oxidase subunit 4|nr:hypothetical protein [Candidatus Cloacimonadota bacterium]